MRALLLLLVLAFPLGAALPTPHCVAVVGEPCVPWATLAHDFHYQYATYFGGHVFRTQADVDAFWEEMVGREPTPQVDFEGAFVVAVVGFGGSPDVVQIVDVVSTGEGHYEIIYAAAFVPQFDIEWVLTMWQLARVDTVAGAPSSVTFVGPYEPVA